MLENKSQKYVYGHNLLLIYFQSYLKNKQSTCSNDLYSPYLHDFFAAISLTSQIFGYIIPYNNRVTVQALALLWPCNFETPGHFNWYQKVNFSHVYYDTKFERNHLSS